MNANLKTQLEEIKQRRFIGEPTPQQLEAAIEFCRLEIVYHAHVGEKDVPLGYADLMNRLIGQRTVQRVRQMEVERGLR
jgi:hypothetical protein